MKKNYLFCLRNISLIVFVIFFVMACGSSEQAGSDSDTTKGSDTMAQEKDHDQGGHDWTYDDIKAWGGLCNEGRSQSPVNISGAVANSALVALELQYVVANRPTIVNNGHSIQIDCPEGSSLTVEGKQYSLKQFHYHSPSEHEVGGKLYDLEVHLVHVADDGSIAVIGILYEKGAHNSFFDTFLPYVGGLTKGDPPYELEENINVKAMLPASPNYYTYMGSLTTPPCTESVKWFVYKEILQIDEQQLGELAGVMPHPNNRPVLPLNGRTIEEF